MNLSNTQEKNLSELVNLYQKKGCALKTAEIVQTMNYRSPGAIRNLMQTMKTLGLVRGIAGPRGGYLPTGLPMRTSGSDLKHKTFPSIEMRNFQM